MRLLRSLLILVGLLGAGFGLSVTAQAAPLPNAAVAGQVGADAGLTTQVRWRRYGYGPRFYGYRRPFYRPRFYGYRRPYYRRPFYRRPFFAPRRRFYY